MSPGLTSEERLREIRKRLADFREVGLALILFYVLNLALFAAIRTRPNLLEYLSLSLQRLWGVVTSVFVSCDAETRFLGKLFLWLVLRSGFLANTIVFFVWPAGLNGRPGASGMVYAAGGAFVSPVWF
jgi:hypothetical protein